jgi:membrane-associated phospholipid phosphatase
MVTDWHREVPGRDRLARPRSCRGLRRYADAHPRRITLSAVVGFALFVVVGLLAPRLQLNPGGLNTPEFPDVGATMLAAGAAVCVDLLLLCAFTLHDRAVVRGVYRAQDPGGLVPPVLRPFCWLVILPSLAGVAVLASRVAGSHGPLRVDQRIDDRIAYRLLPLRPVLSRLVELGSPTGVAVLCTLLAVGCLTLRRVRAAILAAAGPTLAGALTEYALKPLIGRHKGGGLAFPSGHTTGAVALAVTITLFLLPAGAFAGLPRPVRVVLATFAAVLASALPLGLIALHYHYATDVLAGAALAVALILTLALLLDAVTRRLASSRPRHIASEPPTTPGPRTGVVERPR